MRIMMADIYEHPYINDFELDGLRAENPALYLRRMWGYLNMGRGLVHTPLAFANLPVTRPSFSAARETFDGASGAWASGAVGFDLAVLREVDGDGATLGFPVFDYVPHTGMVYFEKPPEAGSVLSADFYTDGWFDAPDGFTHGDDFIHLLRIAMLAVWEERFSGSSLDRVAKVSDRTVSFHSEGNWLKENAAKAQATKDWLSGEMRRVQDKITLRRGL